MGPITQRNNSEIQQLRVGTPHEDTRPTGNWTPARGEPYVPSAQIPPPAPPLHR